MLAIIGMSPGNSYFKDREVAFLLRETIKRYGKTAIMVADIPAISTYQAMWYTPSKARSKAVLNGNNLKNRTKRIINDLGIQDENIIIVNRDLDIKDNPAYLEKFASVLTLYQTNNNFQKSVNKTSQEVLDKNGKEYTSEDIQQATHYLLSEIAFLEYAPLFFKTPKIAYIYHKNRRIYEDYIAWIFDGTPKWYLDFILLEAPHETYLPLVNRNKTRLEIVQERGIINCSFVPYYEQFTIDNEWNYSGVFFDIIGHIAQKNNLQLKFVEQTGYGTLTQRLITWDIDIFCSPTWPTAIRKLEMFFSVSLFESNIFAYINTNSPYAAQELVALQENPYLRIAVKENDIHYELAQKYFPHARLVRVPQLSHIEEVITFVLDQRADMTFREDKLVNNYLKQHNISATQLTKKDSHHAPIATYNNCYALPRGEFDFKKLIDDGIDTYRNSHTYQQ